VTVWTISSQPGSGGEQIARLLSERAGVPLVDPRTMLDARGTVDRSTRIRRVADWLSEASASAGSMLVAPTNILPPRCEVPDYQELTDLIVLEAARSPAVILDWSAFAVLRDHPAAYHVRIRAPLKWRARLYARENCLPQEVSEQALSRLERERRSSLQRRKGEVPDAPENFALVCDASRIPSPDLVELLLVAGRRTTSPVSVFVDPA
jgi:cytidylate kinase